MRLTSGGLFAVLLTWSAVAGSLTGWGIALGVLPLAVAGGVMTAVCPAGVTCRWLWGQVHGS